MSNLCFIGGYSAKTSDNLSGLTGGWISDLANDKFTVAGPYYPLTPDWLTGWMDTQISDCLKYNLRLAYTIVPRRTITDSESPKYHGLVGSPIRVANLNSHGDDEVTDASDEQIEIWVADIEQQIRTAVADANRNEKISAWYLMPEEMRYWRDKELTLLRRMHEAVKRIDPLKRPTFMYEPQHSQAERLERTIPYQDIVTVGIYPHYSGNDHQRVQIRHTMTQIMQAIKSTESNALPIPALEMFENDERPYPPEDVSLIPTFVKHDAYCALANGAKGFLIWSMGRRSGFTRYTDYYNAWAGVSRELFRFGLDDVILYGKVLNEVTAVITSGQPRIRFQWLRKADGSYQIDATYPSISLRDWSYKLRRYLLIVNSSNESIEVTIRNLKKGTYQELFTRRKYNVKASSLTLSLSSFGVLILTVRDCSKLIKLISESM